MAGFKAHIKFGVMTGIIWSGVVVIFSLLSPKLVPLILIATIVGSFLPDLDSNQGIPLRILLKTFSIIGGITTGYIMFESQERSFIQAILYSILCGLFIYFIVGGVFKKITNHRGIFHSIPAVILSGLIALSLFNLFIVDLELKIILSLAIGIGYLCHLVLDEMNSIVNLEGTPFVPNKSLGSALKLYSKNWIPSIAVYILIAFLTYFHWSLIYEFFKVNISPDTHWWSRY